MPSVRVHGTKRAKQSLANAPAACQYVSYPSQDIEIGGNLSENSAVPNEPQSADHHPARPAPEYGVRLPDGNTQAGPVGQSGTVPAWHPESAAPAPGGHASFPSPAAHHEDHVRGTLFALAVVPLGIIAWMILWKFGWITSLVTFGAAALAARLYVLGTGGTLSRKGVWAVSAITAVTALLAFLGGMWLDAADYIGGSPLAMVLDPEPWDLIGYNLATNPDFVKGYAGDFFMALLFGALGCFFTLRSLFAATK